ncbi:MAG: hypothetical protein AB7H93_02555 [Vicinamibacterales bacterium]
MEPLEMEDLLRNIDDRLTRVEQKLPTLATKDDLTAFATKADMREEGERTRRHFDVVAEKMRDDVRLSLEGHQRLTERVDDLERSTGALDRRVRLLEAGAPRRKR